MTATAKCTIEIDPTRSTAFVNLLNEWMEWDADTEPAPIPNPDDFLAPNPPFNEVVKYAWAKKIGIAGHGFHWGRIAWDLHRR